MIVKNLLRRKGRTILTIFGISIGVAAIVGLGTLAAGLESGYNKMLTGSKSDLVLSQPDSFDISYSSIDESVQQTLEVMPEVKAVSGMMEGFVQTEGSPFFIVFGYPTDSYLLGRFQIISGFSLASQEAVRAHRKTILLGSAAAEALKKKEGDTLRIGSSSYQILGIFQSGDAFEDGGAVLPLDEAQELLGKPRQVNLYYIQLKDPELYDRLSMRIKRQYPELELSGTGDYADKQMLGDMLYGYVWAIAGLAIVIGGVGMMNAQLMSVFERTREIGVLRAMGWSGFRVLIMILGESLIVCLVGGALGVGIGWLILRSFSDSLVIFGASTGVKPTLLAQAFMVVLVLGLVGGLYPAWRASRMQPVEALRYEGGSGGGRVRRLPVGGMAVQSLWQRSTRTLLTLSAIGLTVGSIMALEGVIRGTTKTMTEMAIGADVEIMIRQADIADTEFSAIDERIGDKIASFPEVENVSGLLFSAILLPENNSFFMILGYAPNEYAIQRLNVVDGEHLTTNHQILLGRTMSEALNKHVGDTIDLAGARFRVVGVYESGVSWEELGGVITLRDAQNFIGRPHKVSMYGVKLNNPEEGIKVVEKINTQIPAVHATLTGEFVEQMPDMNTIGGLLNGISTLAILVGGVGVLNTMLMAVMERTREIGVLRAIGWRRRFILGLIIKEALLIGFLGGIAGIGIAFCLVFLFQQIPMIGEAFEPLYEWDVFARAIIVALLLGLLGGLYPAYRATLLQPVEALRYE
jgi:ABC-type antimicrobial peptide transport system permease subunit